MAPTLLRVADRPVPSAIAKPTARQIATTSDELSRLALTPSDRWMSWLLATNMPIANTANWTPADKAMAAPMSRAAEGERLVFVAVTVGLRRGSVWDMAFS